MKAHFCAAAEAEQDATASRKRRGDGLPDSLDACLNDATNDSSWWPGGAWWVNNSRETYEGAWFAGSPLDTDGDGLPNSLDPYPNDWYNHSSVSFAGGDFRIDGQWLHLESSTVSMLPDDGANADPDADGLPNFLDPYIGDPSNNSAQWLGGSYLYNGSYRYYEPTWHRADAGDQDQDGVPDDLDSYPWDAANNSNWWSGGRFLVDNIAVEFFPQYYAASVTDSDSDGIPDGFDTYQLDPQNGNTSARFWWDGGDFTVAGVTRTWPARYYLGNPADPDGDGIPASEDPAPSDPLNPEAVWYYWGGGAFYVNNTLQGFGAVWYEGPCADRDGDTIPDPLDPAPDDPANGSTPHQFAAASFYIDGEARPLLAYTYYGPADTDGDTIPDDLDPYPADAANNSVYWPGEVFLISGEQTLIPGGYLPASWNDQDFDGIPDKFDPQPNDLHNNNYFLWPLVPTAYTIAGDVTTFTPRWYLLPTTDTDGDFIPDAAEVNTPYGNDPTNGNDSGGDGLLDRVELWFGFDPHQAYSPGLLTRDDGLTWPEAYQLGLSPDPLDPELDSDWDGMKDTYELTYQLNRWDAADAWRSPMHDFIFNVEKAELGVSPHDTSSFIQGCVYFTRQINPAVLYHDWRLSDDENDWDGDGISNYDERVVFSTEPRSVASHPDTNAIIQALTQGQGTVTTRRHLLWLVDPAANLGLDTDHDGLPDWYEHVLGTDPAKLDSDGDGLPDYWEIKHGFNPLAAADGAGDRDDDGLSNAHEFQLGTGVDNPDSDGDGMSDGWEVRYGFNPGSGGEAGEDYDGDGLSNSAESALGTNPFAADTDSDGASDGEEGGRGSDPTKSDTDGDGILDGQDAVPYDTDFVHAWRPLPHFAVIKLDPQCQYSQVNDRGELIGTNRNGARGVWRGDQFTIASDVLDLNNRGDYVTTSGSRLIYGTGASPATDILLPPVAPAPPADYVLDSETMFFVVEAIDDLGVVHGHATASYRYTLPLPDPCVDGPSDYSETYVVSWPAPAPGAASQSTVGQLGGRLMSSSPSGDSMAYNIQFGYSSGGGDFQVYGTRYGTISSARAYHYAGSYTTGSPISIDVTTLLTATGDYTAPSPPNNCSTVWTRQTHIDFPTVPITFHARDQNITYPDSENFTEPQFDWVCSLSLVAGRTSSNSGYGCLWANGHQKLLGPTSWQHRIKINDLGQAILKNDDKNFWQNGKMYKLDDLTMLGDGEHVIRPYDISTGESNILVALKNKDDSSCYALLILADMRISNVPGSTRDSGLLSHEVAQAPGAYVPVNANNDNGSAFKKVQGLDTHLPEHRDFDCDHLPKDDPELVRLRLDVNRKLLYSTRLINDSTGRAKIKLWKDPRKNALFLAEGHRDEPFATLPAELWVEGAREGAAQGEISLKKMVIAGGKIQPAEAITITVTPILETYASKTLNVSAPQFDADIEGKGWKGLVAAASTADPNNVEVRAVIFRKNLPDSTGASQVQTVSVTNSVAAVIYDVNLGRSVKTYSYDFLGSGAGKTLLDSTPFPFYGYERSDFHDDRVETWLLDGPHFSLVTPGPSEIVSLSMFWLFDAYVVWQFPDKSIYPIGHTRWNVHWQGTYRLESSPAGQVDVWQAGNANAIKVSDAFTRENQDPPITLPTAKSAGSDFK